MSQDGAQDRYAGRSVGGGRYQLRDLLGEGGMASVHLAYDSVLDRQVAIKTLHSELGREASFRERFRREAQSVAKLSHTNIVSVFDSGEDDIDGAMVPYIIMEYVEGKPLGSVLSEDIAEHGAMPADKALKITADVLAALEVSHEMGLVHRDIKPGNVMMNKRGIVKVMDFGIARAMQSGVTSMTQTGMVVGTPQYLSPEQALGRGVDARSDLYSVGIMLFQLLTGRLPFEADSPLAIAYAHVQEEPVAPSSINRSISPAVDALIARALRKNPNERFPTAESMRDETSRVMRTGNTGATPLIISEGPRARSGVDIAAAVFPPATGAPQHTPVPPNVQTPYQPQAHAGQYGGFGPSTPPPPTHQMGQQQGYQTPAPYNTNLGTPPPYNISPHAPSNQGGGHNNGGHNGGGNGGGNKKVIVGAGLVAALAVIGVIVAITLNGNGSKSATADDKPSHKASAQTDPGGDSGGEAEPSVKPEDKTRTIETDDCTDAYEDYKEKTKVDLPDFYTKHLASAKACMDAASWDYEVVYENGGIWGKNSVLRQSPEAGEAFDEKSGKITLTVATGRP
ncbi:protein kinase domain-containing protein [Streptomyces sp. H27-D2]|uniref:protein kinase domain-containing protein n=1 Tax=Streptomyces sp. H27-D2 TaxID=3046304 RepID=UPI002DB84C7A|nr:protein kinase [Streptomyces sp. H27-D2]MEC4017366.1 protein kinase [Streptomyces sp. H27-D2]